LSETARLLRSAFSLSSVGPVRPYSERNFFYLL